MGIQI